MLGAAVMEWNRNPTFKAAQQSDDGLIEILRHMVQAAVELGGRPALLDKSRDWPAPGTMATMERVLGRPMKVVATVRNVADCAASFVRVKKPEDLGAFLSSNPLLEHLKASYMTLAEGFNAFPGSFLFVDYDDLLADPDQELRRIVDFLGIDWHDFDYAQIDGASVAEDDEVWGIPGLHDVAPILKRQHSQTAEECLGSRWREFDQPQFWHGEVARSRDDDLDRQLKLALDGKFEESAALVEKLAVERPDCPRVAFNRGWHLMASGDLRAGHEHMSSGREIGAWGNPSNSGAPIWKIGDRGTVLLNLEGGLGDQIHQARYAASIARYAGKCVVSCTADIAPLIQEIDGVTAVIAREYSGWIYHDFRVQGMDAPIALEMTWDCVCGDSYISGRQENARLVGARWRGNQQFEHEQHRAFPVEPFMKVLGSVTSPVISLQRDFGAEDAPPWMLKCDLSDWQHTRAQVARCELVITSCTSIAHLAGAMGVETWVIVPVLPYYLWSLPGAKTPHYDSVRLFRQKTFGEWSNVFEEIGYALEARK